MLIVLFHTSCYKKCVEQFGKHSKQPVSSTQIIINNFRRCWKAYSVIIKRFPTSKLCANMLTHTSPPQKKRSDISVSNASVLVMWQHSFPFRVWSQHCHRAPWWSSDHRELPSEAVQSLNLEVPSAPRSVSCRWSLQHAGVCLKPEKEIMLTEGRSRK